jgi:AAA+ ATPase superfamily predicted ATPase
MALAPFVGRSAELERLQRHLQAVARDGQGRLLSVRGRRQVGKSRLLTELCRSSDAPSFFFTASLQPSREAELERFRDDLERESTLPDASRVAGVTFANWDAALRQLADLLPHDRVSIVVVDEFPWLFKSDGGLDGTLQKNWDRHLEQRPVLWILVGSDLTMMERLTQHDRPLFGRAKEMVIEPLNPADAAAVIGCDDGADALESYLVTGGYPRLLLERRHHRDLDSYINDQLADENSDLAVVGQRVLTSEFPKEMQALQILGAIGTGQRTYKGIAQASGVGAGPLARALKSLRAEKRLVTAALPLSSKPSRETRYWIADPYLRFWLHFVQPSLPYIARGRPDVPLRRFAETWPTYTGRAIEPLVRHGLLLLAVTDERLGGATQVGGYWTRTNRPEVDLVGLVEQGRHRRVCFVGSIKWRRQSTFADKDWRILAQQQAQVPGANDATLVAVSRHRSLPFAAGATFSADDILAAFRR